MLLAYSLDTEYESRILCYIMLEEVKRKKEQEKEYGGVRGRKGE